MPVATSVDFFQYQDVARKKTSLLVFYYIVAVALIIVSVYLAYVAVFIGMQSKGGEAVDVGQAIWNPLAFAWVTGVTVAIVLLGTLYKIAELGKGGEAVALMLGGRPIDPGSADRNERKILNVVEEMAIASGTPVPRVFLLDQEEGINAFAAGFSTNDCVIGVTRGCITQLNRDELQGVIAHEFSHIFNGDMRLNIRLIGVLNGILIIALIGYWTFRSVGRSRSSSRGKGGGAVAAIALFGLLLMVIGYIGVFFGKLIKSAVSRQREYLADASAVQFTRNPDGIANALKKIGGLITGSRVTNDHAQEASHLFFANGLRSSFLNLMATHPPLEDRIRRLDPQFDGSFGKVTASAAGATELAAMSGFTSTSGGGPTLALKPGEVISRVGAPTAAHLVYASTLMASLPTRLSEMMRESVGACAVTYALLLAKDEAVRTAQMAALDRSAGRDVLERMKAVGPLIAVLKPEARLPVADVAIGALRSLTREEYTRFVANLNELVNADKEIDLFEYTLQRMVMRRLAPVFEKTRPGAIEYYDWPALRPTAAKLLSCLAYWGADDLPAAQKAFAAGAEAIKKGTLQMLPVDQCGLPALDDSLAQFSVAAPVIKRTILTACTACIGADGEVTIDEAELLRAVGDALDCPIPPFMPGEKV